MPSLLDSRVTHPGPPVTVTEERWRHGDLELDILVASPTSGRPGVVVLPVYGGDVGLVRQWRYALRRYVWETPRGFSDGADPVDDARRELVEETGALAGAVTDLGTVDPDSGILTGGIRLFHADVTELASPDGHGVDEVGWWPAGHVLSWVADGTITCALTATVVTRAHLRGLLPGT